MNFQYPRLGTHRCVPMAGDEKLRQTYLYYRFQCARSGAITPAHIALRWARQDLRDGKHHYAPSGPWPAAGGENRKRCVVENAGDDFRLVGYVVPESSAWDKKPGQCGWYTDDDPCLDRLTQGVVYQLPARKGTVRFVAGYVHHGCDGGPVLNLTDIYEDTACRDIFYLNEQELDAARTAAGVADSMAQHAAESERKYNRAWQAGSSWSQYLDELKSAGDEASCSAVALRQTCPTQTRCIELLRADIRRNRSDIDTARKRMRTLQEGDDDTLGFYTGDETLRAAFNEGAGEQVL